MAQQFTYQILSHSAKNWVIADLNHDSTTDTIDLICKSIVRKYKYGNLGTVSYQNSSLRTPYNNVLYSGFSSSIKSIMNTIGEYSDHIICPSIVELGLNGYEDLHTGITEQQGTIYPIYSPVYNLNMRVVRTRYNGNLTGYYTRTVGTTIENVLYFTSGDICKINQVPRQITLQEL